MPKRAPHRIGDVILVPLDDDRVAVSQVVGSYEGTALYFAVFGEPCPPSDLACIESRLDNGVVLLVLSDEVKAGRWRVVTNRTVDTARIPFPAYIESVYPPGSFEVVDPTGERRRPATAEEAEALDYRRIVAPVRIEKAVRALHGLQPWDDDYNEFRVRPEKRSSFVFPDGELVPERSGTGGDRLSDVPLFRRKQSGHDDGSANTGLTSLDRAVVDQLVSRGADLTQPRHALYYLYFPSEEAADRAADEARREGFEATVREPLEDSDEWSLICEAHAVLDADTVRANGNLFEEIAGRGQGEYDGWEASV